MVFRSLGLYVQESTIYMVDAGGCWELGLTSNPDGTGLDSVELTINNRDEATASFVLGLIKEEFSLYRTGSNTFRYELKAKYIMDYIHELNRIHKKKEVSLIHI